MKSKSKEVLKFVLINHLLYAYLKHIQSKYKAYTKHIQGNTKRGSNPYGFFLFLHLVSLQLAI